MAVENLFGIYKYNSYLSQSKMKQTMSKEKKELIKQILEAKKNGDKELVQKLQQKL